MKLNMYDERNHLTREQIELLKSTLTNLLELVLKKENLPRPFAGICCNWAALLVRAQGGPTGGDPLPVIASIAAYKVIRVIGHQWPGYNPDTSCEDHPIPGSNYQSVATLWQGRNRELRISLMRYTLKRLRDWHRRTLHLNQRGSSHALV